MWLDFEVVVGEVCCVFVLWLFDEVCDEIVWSFVVKV